MASINKHKRHGILHTGLWELGFSKEEEGALSPRCQASLSDATNIRSVVLDFRGRIDEDLVPFVSHGGVAYSFNFFLSDFHTLKRVELELPDRSSTTDEEVNLLRKKRLSDAIELGNSRLGSGAKLSSVTAFHVWYNASDDEVEFWLDEMECRDKWFWQADEGCFLTSKKGATSVKSSGVTPSGMYQDVEALGEVRRFIPHESLYLFRNIDRRD
jgi:hypothetical protein